MPCLGAICAPHSVHGDDTGSRGHPADWPGITAGIPATVPGIHAPPGHRTPLAEGLRLGRWRRRSSDRRTTMQKLPHRYVVVAAGDTLDDIELASHSLPPLRSAPPTEFDGPGDRWSPESLLVGAVAGCYVLTFRAVARASRVSWTWLRCDVSGTLERIDKRDAVHRLRHARASQHSVDDGRGPGPKGHGEGRKPVPHLEFAQGDRSPHHRH